MPPLTDSLGNPIEDPTTPIPETPPETPSEPATPPPTIDDGGIAVVPGEPASETPETPPSPETPPPAPAPAPHVPAAPDPLRNKLFAQDRIINSMRRQQEETSRSIQQIAQTIAELRAERQAGLFRPVDNNGGQLEDEVDKLVKEGKWKDGVQLMITRGVKSLTDQQRQEMAVARQAEEARVAQVANINRVIQRHPELDDPISEKWQVYQSALEANPRWRNSPDGPLLAMYEMEERMNLPRSTRSAAAPAAPTPVRPGVPVGGAPINPSLPPTRPAAVKTIALTAEQKAFCDDNQIAYDDYVRSLGFMARGEGKVGISV